VDVAVEMGRVRFGFQAVGGSVATEEQGVRGPGGEPLDLQPASVGNPHCVVFRDALGEADLLALGPHLTRHPAFPAGANVQLARVSGEGEVQILIWERGVGRTSASGTSACAVAAACVHTGRLAPGRIRVGMEGGSFRVTVSEEEEVRLEGPVQPVMEGELAAELLATFAP
jgi:diaminopimelate epimerase